ncbi:MAG: hypothetical protein IJI45_18340 [Anaerolineaceae bacterium]|nr:hypothetical protein [Anaerolineaceae bacterium]
MNELIETIFANWTVGGTLIPMKFLRYNGHGEPYVTYMQTDADASLSGDDGLIGYADYYDFDVYSKGNYRAIIDDLTQKLVENGFVWVVSRSSGDQYEDDTGYYHKTLTFGILRGYENG